MIATVEQLVCDLCEACVRVFGQSSGIGMTVNQIVEWVRERYPLTVEHADPIPGEIRESIGKPDIKLPEVTREKVWEVFG